MFRPNSNQSLIITGKSREGRLSEALEIASLVSDKFDTFVADALVDRGIEGVKVILSRAFQKPYQSEKTTHIISEADNLTVEAQNALLKILEEPPSSAQFILCAASVDNLLPTISSRCLEIKLEEGDHQANLSPDELLSLPFEKQLEKIEALEISDYLSAWNSFLRKRLEDSGSKALSLKWLTFYLRLILKMKKAQKASVNKKLIALTLSLELPNKF